MTVGCCYIPPRNKKIVKQIDCVLKNNDQQRDNIKETRESVSI